MIVLKKKRIINGFVLIREKNYLQGKNFVISKNIITSKLLSMQLYFYFLKSF